MPGTKPVVIVSGTIDQAGVGFAHRALDPVHGLLHVLARLHRRNRKLGTGGNEFDH